MANKNRIGAVLTLKDNMSATLRGIKKEQSSFRKDVRETRRSLEEVYKKKHELKLNHTSAAKKIKEIKKSLDPLRKKVVVAMAYKDMISARIRKVKNELKNMGRMVVSPVVKLKNMITGGGTGGSKRSNGIMGMLGLGMLNPYALVAAATGGGLAATGMSAVSKGAELEKQNISMEHFIATNNKDLTASQVVKQRDVFMGQLRENANKTPFETSEVLAAGTRAVGIAGGSIKDAMGLVKVAEDMAALTPGKTVSDAMEALADAKNGEMERLKEFNAKVSAEEYKTLGFKGIVDQRLKSQFEGGAEKLAGSGSGLWSTIKGKMGSKIQDTGLKMLEKLKPAMEDVIGLIDKYGPAMDKLGDNIASGIGKAVTHFKDFMNNMDKNKDKY